MSGIETSKAVAGGIVMGNGAVVVSSNQVIDIKILEDFIILGMTFGAWTKVFLFVSIVFLVFGNASKLILNVFDIKEKWKRGDSKKKSDSSK